MNDCPSCAALREALEESAEHLQSCCPANGWGLLDKGADADRAETLAKVRAALSSSAGAELLERLRTAEHAAELGVIDNEKLHKAWDERDTLKKALFQMQEAAKDLRAELEQARENQKVPGFNTSDNAYAALAKLEARRFEDLEKAEGLLRELVTSTARWATDQDRIRAFLNRNAPKDGFTEYVERAGQAPNGCGCVGCINGDGTCRAPKDEL